MKHLTFAFEILLALAAISFSVAWALNPSGQYEPYIVLLTTIAFAVTKYGRRRDRGEGLRRRAAPTEVIGSSEPEAPALNENRNSFLDPSESASFFSVRFAQAFPGVRSLQWFEGREGVKRLKVLLAEPLVFEYRGGKTTPIWWWRGGNFYISTFRVLRGNVVLLDGKELKVRRLAAVPSPSYYRSFVYLEAAPMRPCGAYKWTEEKKREWAERHGYAWEEYGLFKGKHVVSRAEYDDNAAVIRGRLTVLGREVELRERYLTPYNLIIAPHDSPINNGRFDAELISFMDRMLKGEARIEELADRVHRLPKRDEN